MSSSVVPAALSIAADGLMSSEEPGPRADGPSRRRSFTPAQKLEYLAAYEEAYTTGQGGAYRLLNTHCPQTP